MPASAIATDASAAATSERSSAFHPLLAVLCLLFLWFILCRHLSSEWSSNEQYSYGWFVPFFAAFLFWLRWETRPEKAARGQTTEDRGQQSAAEISNSNLQTPDNPQLSTFNSQLLAAALAIAALLLLLPLRVFEIANPDWRPLGWLHAGIVVGLTLIYIWYVGGSAWVRHFAFPVAFILIAVPWVSSIEEPIVQGLMRIVAAAAAETVSLFGIPAQLQGNLIRLPRGLVGVSEACSGVRSLQTSLMIGLLFGELKRFDISRRLALLAGAIAIALLGNFFRAVFLVWVAAKSGVSATEHWHDIAGYSIVGLVFVGTVLFAAWLSKNRKSQVTNQRSAGEQSGKRKAESGKHAANSEEQKAESRHASLVTYHSSSPPISTFYFLLSTFLWLLTVEVAAAGWYRAHERNVVRQPAWTVRWPETAAGYSEIPISDGVRSTLRFDKGREVRWQENDSANGESASSVYLFFFRWNPGSASVLRARAHRPDFCLPKLGWQRIADLGLKQYSTSTGLTLTARHISFRQENSNVIAHTFFCLQEDKTRGTEPAPEQLPVGKPQPEWSAQARVRTVESGIRNLGQQVLEVAFITAAPMTDEAAQERFAHLVNDLVVER